MDHLSSFFLGQLQLIAALHQLLFKFFNHPALVCFQFFNLNFMFFFQLSKFRFLFVKSILDLGLAFILHLMKLLHVITLSFKNFFDLVIFFYKCLIAFSLNLELVLMLIFQLLDALIAFFFFFFRNSYRTF